jgi:hypothetical protein
MALCLDRFVVALLGLLLLAAPLHAASTTEDTYKNDFQQPKLRVLTELCQGKTMNDRYLKANLTKCEAKDKASPDTPVIYSFELDGKPDFDIFITLRMTTGAAILYAPAPTL